MRYNLKEIDKNISIIHILWKIILNYFHIWIELRCGNEFINMMN